MSTILEALVPRVRAALSALGGAQRDVARMCDDDWRHVAEGLGLAFGDGCLHGVIDGWSVRVIPEALVDGCEGFVVEVFGLSERAIAAIRDRSGGEAGGLMLAGDAGGGLSLADSAEHGPSGAGD